MTVPEKYFDRKEPGVWRKVYKGMLRRQNMKIEYTNKRTAGKAMLLTALGVLEALKEKSISVEEAVSFIFLPGIITTLRKEGVSRNVLKIIDMGCELEDIESLIPEELDHAIEEMITEVYRILKWYEKIEDVNWLIDWS